MLPELIFRSGEAELCQVRRPSGTEATVSLRCFGERQVYWHLRQVRLTIMTGVPGIALAHNVDLGN